MNILSFRHLLLGSSFMVFSVLTSSVGFASSRQEDDSSSSTPGARSRSVSSATLDFSVPSPSASSAADPREDGSGPSTPRNAALSVPQDLVELHAATRFLKEYKLGHRSLFAQQMQNLDIEGEYARLLSFVVAASAQDVKNIQTFLIEDMAVQRDIEASVFSLRVLTDIGAALAEKKAFSTTNTPGPSQEDALGGPSSVSSSPAEHPIAAAIFSLIDKGVFSLEHSMLSDLVTHAAVLSDEERKVLQRTLAARMTEQETTPRTAVFLARILMAINVTLAEKNVSIAAPAPNEETPAVTRVPSIRAPQPTAAPSSRWSWGLWRYLVPAKTSIIPDRELQECKTDLTIIPLDGAAPSTSAVASSTTPGVVSRWPWGRHVLNWMQGHSASTSQEASALFFATVGADGEISHENPGASTSTTIHADLAQKSDSATVVPSELERELSHMTAEQITRIMPFLTEVSYGLRHSDSEREGAIRALAAADTALTKKNRLTGVSAQKFETHFRASEGAPVAPAKKGLLGWNTWYGL